MDVGSFIVYIKTDDINILQKMLKLDMIFQT